MNTYVGIIVGMSYLKLTKSALKMVEGEASTLILQMASSLIEDKGD
jgi:hypothetical protein